MITIKGLRKELGIKSKPRGLIGEKAFTEYYLPMCRHVFHKRFSYAVPEDFKDQNSKLSITCPEHGEFTTDISSHLQSEFGCPECSRLARLKTPASFIDAARAVHGSKYQYRKRDVRCRSGETIEVKCPEHGIFTTTRDLHVNRGQGCPKCGKEKASAKLSLGTDEFVRRAKQRYGDQFDYSKTEYKHAREPVTVTCKDHGDFTVLPSYHVREDSTGGCPECRKESYFTQKLVTSQEFFARCRQVWQNEYTYDETEERPSKSNITLYCKVHGEQKVWGPAHLYSKRGCPICAKVVTKPMLELAESFTEGLSVNCRSVIRNPAGNVAELDLYWEDSGVAVEVDGVYYHAGLPRLYHYDKTARCKEKGIRLFHFWDYEIESKTAIVKSVLANALGRTKHRLGARKLQITDISSKQAREFFNNNHLQGYASSSVTYGLVTSKGKLAMAMSFAKDRFGGCEWELVRLASHCNVQVMGGAARLLKHFEKEHKPKSLVSYADLRISYGDVYKHLGFTLSHRAQPNYKWCSGKDATFSRYQTQKHKLKDVLPGFDPALSEAANMQKAGYSRLYDCGNLVFKKFYQ